MGKENGPQVTKKLFQTFIYITTDDYAHFSNKYIINTLYSVGQNLIKKCKIQEIYLLVTQKRGQIVKSIVILYTNKRYMFYT